MTTRVRFGSIFADSLTLNEALDAIVALHQSGGGGYVVTPNVDHVVLAEDDERLRQAYDDAALSLVDGTPLVWLSRLYGHALPEKLSGSDLVEPLVARAARDGLSVYLLGGAPGIANRAAAVWQARYPGLVVAGVDAPPIGFEKDATTAQAVIEKIQAKKPAFVFVALGCPKQELWMQKNGPAIAPAVALGIGASIDFVAGTVKRAPKILSRLGLEWAFRLAQEPKRMYQRYLVRDRKIFAIALRTLRRPRHERVYQVSKVRA